MKKQLDAILKIRDTYKPYSPEWLELNRQKALLLEKHKPSTSEDIICFEEICLKQIKEGFEATNTLKEIPYIIGRRSLLEHNPLQRHPIPYCIIKYNDKYFFILREKGSGEIRLVGAMGMVGGHIGIEDVDKNSFKNTIYNGLKRELQEETNITDDMIKSIELKGTIKSNDGVDSDHLGYVFEIELNTDKIKTEEDGIISGVWIDKEDLKDHYKSFENWSKIVYDNVIMRG